MKVIVSVKALWMLMEKENRFPPDKDELITLNVKSGKLYFSGLNELDVESKSDAEFELSKRQFKQLRKVLRAAADQPIVLYVASNTLYIQNLCF